MKHPQVNAPRQARSRATMERIVAATEELLAAKPFEQITIAEISARCGSAPTAIYARFSDKTALLLEVHERFKERATGAIQAAFDHRDQPIEEYVATAAEQLTALYRTHHHLLRSVLLADNPVMYARAADLTRTISELLATRMLAAVEADGRAAAERDVDFAVRTALALLQQDLLFGDQPPTRFPLTPDELTTRITTLILAAAPSGW